MRETICIFHGNCADGFGAAWVVRKALHDQEVHFHKAFHNDAFLPDVKNKIVYIVDFSYSRDDTLKLAKEAYNIVIIDHHKTAIDVLVDLPFNVELFGDVNHSGAMLAWQYFFPKDTPPELLKHIEDRDLWKFKLSGTREIQAGLFSYPYDFNVWDKFMSSSTIDLFLAGQSIERKHFKDIDELLPKCTRMIEIDGYKIETANLPYTLGADAAMLLAKDQPFGCTYYDLSNKTKYFSLRSDENGIDVSEIAKKFGGGGHKHAAAFTISFEAASKFELD